MTVDLVGNGKIAENVVENELDALVLRVNAYACIFVREHVAVEEAVLAFVLQCSKGLRKRHILE